MVSEGQAAPMPCIRHADAICMPLPFPAPWQPGQARTSTGNVVGRHLQSAKSSLLNKPSMELASTSLGAARSSSRIHSLRRLLPANGCSCFAAPPFMLCSGPACRGRSSTSLSTFTAASSQGHAAAPLDLITKKSFRAAPSPQPSRGRRYLGLGPERAGAGANPGRWRAAEEPCTGLKGRMCTISAYLLRAPLRPQLVHALDPSVSAPSAWSRVMMIPTDNP